MKYLSVISSFPTVQLSSCLTLLIGLRVCGCWVHQNPRCDVQSEVFRLTTRWWAAGFVRTITVRSSYSASTSSWPTYRSSPCSILGHCCKQAPAWCMGVHFCRCSEKFGFWKHLCAVLPPRLYRADSTLTFDSICTKADEKLFSSITGNRHHRLHPLLPP